MRKITAAQVTAFMSLILLCVAVAAGATWATYGSLAVFGEFRAIIAVAIFGLVFQASSIVAYRAFCRHCPIPEGPIARDSREEGYYHVYLLFFLALFYPLMKSQIVPVPLLRLLYLALGAELGANTYSAGILFDPLFIRIGANSLVGQSAMLIPHVIEGEKLAHYRISLGNNVTIGANAVILSDVEIGDNAIVAISSVVLKGTRIPSGETWGGIPARKISGSTTP